MAGRLGAGAKPLSLVKPQTKPKPNEIPCPASDAFTQTCLALLETLPEKVAKVPLDQKPYVLNQVRALLFTEVEKLVLHTAAAHRNEANHRAHPCVKEAIQQVVARLHDIERVHVPPQIDVRRKRVAPSEPAVAAAVHDQLAPLGIKLEPREGTS